MKNKEIIDNHILLSGNGKGFTMGEIEGFMDLAREDERTKVMAEMKEAMDKICPLATAKQAG